MDSQCWAITSNYIYNINSMSNNKDKKITPPPKQEPNYPLNPPPQNNAPMASINLGEQGIQNLRPLSQVPINNNPQATIQEMNQNKPKPEGNNASIQKSYKGHQENIDE